MFFHRLFLQAYVNVFLYLQLILFWISQLSFAKGRRVLEPFFSFYLGFVTQISPKFLFYRWKWGELSNWNAEIKMLLVEWTKAKMSVRIVYLSVFLGTERRAHLSNWALYSGKNIYNWIFMYLLLDSLMSINIFLGTQLMSSLCWI